MRSPKQQRIFSIVLGTGLLVAGSFFILPLMVAAYILGLMLIGFGVEPRMAEMDGCSRPAPVAAAAPKADNAPRMAAAAPKKAKAKPKKRPVRRKK